MPLSSGATDTTGADIQSADLHKVARWVAEITLYDRETQTWYERGKRIVRRYKDERSPIGGDDSRTRYNILWSNTQTLEPALYARNPKPDIQRRFKDADPVGRVVSDILERSATYFCDTDEFGAGMRNCVQDYLLPGRGTTWNRYVPHMMPATEITDDVIEGDSAQESDIPQQEISEVIEYEEVCTDYVHPADFGHNICRVWEEVYCVWRKVYLSRDELIKRFGDEKGNLTPLDYTPTSLNDTKLDSGIGKSTIYELWDKTRRVAVWFHKTVPEALDLRKDPLRLDGFFPCPRPILANITNDSLIPTPFYVEYQDQARELDNLTARIGSLTKSIKVAGAYDASVQALGRILSEGVDNTMIPVESWAMFAEKGGIQGAMSFLPLQEIAEALIQLYQAREQVKKDLHEISGIPDIVRGDSNPNETLGAQQIKTSFATNRISDQQREIQRFARENIRIMVNIICEHFQIETIKQISGVRLFTAAEKQQIGQYQQSRTQAPQSGMPPMPPPQPPQALSGLSSDQIKTMMNDPTWEDVEALIRNNALRCFRIDIETDSTIKADQEADKAARVEFLKAAGMFLQQANEVGAQQPIMVPLLGQMLQFGIRGFPVGKELEGEFNATIQKLEKQAANPQPKPDPTMMKVQADAQASQAKLQAETQLQQAKMQGEMQLAQQKAQIDAQTEAAKAQSQAAVQQHLNELENARENQRMAGEMQLAQFKIESEGRLAIEKAHIDAAARIEVARIAAEASDGAQAEQREASGE